MVFFFNYYYFICYCHIAVPWALLAQPSHPDESEAQAHMNTWGPITDTVNAWLLHQPIECDKHFRRIERHSYGESLFIISFKQYTKYTVKVIYYVWTQYKSKVCAELLRDSAVGRHQKTQSLLCQTKTFFTSLILILWAPSHASSTYSHGPYSCINCFFSPIELLQSNWQTEHFRLVMLSQHGNIGCL